MFHVKTNPTQWNGTPDSDGYKEEDYINRDRLTAKIEGIEKSRREQKVWEEAGESGGSQNNRRQNIEPIEREEREGNLDIQRYAREEEDQRTREGRDNQEQSIHETPQVCRRRIVHSTPTMTDNSPSLLDKMRKWGCYFDVWDPYTFLERIDELHRAYAFSNDEMLRGFPELLRGDALLLYRNEIRVISHQELTNFLRLHYLSPYELSHLENQITSRHQGNNETFRSFVLETFFTFRFVNALRTLMRRHGGFYLWREIDTIYWNMKPHIRLHIHRQ